ncbi:MAG: hypothetical protein KDJ65_01610 [Anaerolineae bacterium]|nr:hypothetical protein [Anaerolineae bacterium]
MAKRLTISQLHQMVAELLNLVSVTERYKALEKDIKAGMIKLGQDEIEVGSGRVFISRTERITISPAVANEVLGVDLGRKVVVTKESVSNKIIEAFLAAGEIDPETHQALQERAERKEVVNLYVRPLK